MNSGSSLLANFAASLPIIALQSLAVLAACDEFFILKPAALNWSVT